MRILLLPLIAAPLLLAACHTPAIDAPSLSPRAEEGRPILPPDDQPREAAAPADPALAGRIAQAVAGADEGHRAFAAQQAETERLAAVAARQPRGGEAWLTAQQALSALAAAQAPVRQAASALDDLRRDPANLTAANRMRIDAAAARIQALEDGEAAAYDALSRRLD